MHSFIYQVKQEDEWRTVTVGSKGFCEGYMDRSKKERPHPEMRIIKAASRAWFDRSDVAESDVVKVIDHLSEEPDVGIGLVAGWAKPEQYERAAQVALDKAAQIRSNESFRLRNRTNG